MAPASSGAFGGVCRLAAFLTVAIQHSSVARCSYLRYLLRYPLFMSSSPKLENRVALVTGASRGIGRSIAIALAAAGANVAVNYRKTQSAAGEVCAEIQRLGRRSIPRQADVSRTPDVDRLVSVVERELGPVDILVNNAGITQVKHFFELTEADWDKILRVNLKSAFLLIRRVLPGMRQRRWGRIINLSSVAAQTGGVIGPHYAASKAGLIGLTHSYASLQRHRPSSH
jgi:3-oxoacyl-[acyl-carrier protein] reductase